jgi:hypothetical protein
MRIRKIQYRDKAMASRARAIGKKRRPTHESYILKSLKQIEADINTTLLEKDSGGLLFPHPGWAYWPKYHYLSGQKNYAYRILTAHDNTYGQTETKKKEK